jgi:hypothetical protein
MLVHHYCHGDDDEVSEDLGPHEDEEMGADNSEIPTREVVYHAITKKTGRNPNPITSVFCKAPTVGLQSRVN